jgi:hypothetical protein
VGEEGVKVNKRFSKERCEEIARDIDAARREFQAGESRPISVDDLMKEIKTENGFNLPDAPPGSAFWLLCRKAPK